MQYLASFFFIFFKSPIFAECTWKAETEITSLIHILVYPGAITLIYSCVISLYGGCLRH